MNLNLNQNNQSQLDIAKTLINDKNINKLAKDIQNDVDLSDFVVELIASNVCSTIGIKYDSGDVIITAIYGDIVKINKFPNQTESSYNDFCSTILKIDINEKYNCSVTENIKGVQSRIYAMMPPLCMYPNITISTTKMPPEHLDKQTIPDEVWNEIVHSNFIIVGASGSGKTYLMNYLLHKYIRKDERVAFIEEFGELIPPNELTIQILVPPPKPGEESLLEFVTYQSNLMRLNATYVGEVKGSEAWPMVMNMASGTRGGATVHGESAAQALNRLKALCRIRCDNDAAIEEFMAKSIKYIIVMKKKNIDSIYKLTGTHNKGQFAMEEISS